MGAERPDPQTSSPQPGNATLFQLRLLRDEGKLNYRALWGEGITEDQKWDLALAVDRIMRSLVPRWRDASAGLDEAARIGHKVQDYPPLAEFIGKTIFVQEVDDASGLGRLEAPDRG